MVSFIISLVALVLGYMLYGKFVAHVFGPDDRPTPAVTKADGVDFMVLPSWKIFMIQFLNIAGTVQSSVPSWVPGMDRWLICGSSSAVSSPEPCTIT